MSSLLTVSASGALKTAGANAWNYCFPMSSSVSRVSSLWSTSGVFYIPCRALGLDFPPKGGVSWESVCRPGLEKMDAGDYGNGFKTFSSILRGYDRLPKEAQARLLNEKGICNLMQRGPFVVNRLDSSKELFERAASLSSENDKVYLSNAIVTQMVRTRLSLLGKVSPQVSYDKPTRLVLHLDRIFASP